MKLEEAIEILEDLDTTLPQSSPEDRRKAVKLGIEALKFTKSSRDPDGYPPYNPLPGETKEQPRDER